MLSYIEIAKAEGADCVLGGKSRPDLGAGLFVEPTIFTGVRNEHADRAGGGLRPGACGDSVRGRGRRDPRSATTSAYGLAAAVWTRDLRRAMLMADKLQAGTVWVNNYRATSFTSPFGGYKESGIGRESGTEAIKEYLHTKCVWISIRSRRAESVRAALTLD